MIDSANCPLCCILLFPLQQACLSSQVVIRCTCCSSCFPYISKKPQQGRAAFPEKAGAKSCILLFSFQQVCVMRSVLSPRSVVKYCTCCSSCFPYISKKAQQGRAAFPEKAAAKVVLCCFPCSRLVLSSQVVIRCTCCSSCFPYIRKKTQYKVLTNRLTRD